MRVELGDKISYGKFIVTVTKIINQNEQGDKVKIEFKDESGNRRRWCSIYGGKIIKSKP